MKKKKLLTVIMAVLLIFTGCSGGGNNQEATSIGAKDADKSLISQSEGNTEAIEKTQRQHKRIHRVKQNQYKKLRLHQVLQMNTFHWMT